MESQSWRMYSRMLLGCSEDDRMTSPSFSASISSCCPSPTSWWSSVGANIVRHAPKEKKPQSRDILLWDASHVVSWLERPRSYGNKQSIFCSGFIPFQEMGQPLTESRPTSS